MKQESVLDHSNKPSTFWFCVGLLVILLASILARDIDRPFYGLHSWQEAAAAWRARCFLKYDLSYTKGLALWEVGNPPSEKPNRSLDHPQLGLFMPAIDMLIFGISERGTRIGGIIRAVLSLLIFLRILRGLLDDKTAILAGLLFVIVPVTAYFGVRGWMMVLSLLATWYYLVIIKAVKNTPEPRTYHKWLLAACLFLTLQMAWEGFFYALAIGVHYVFRCIHRKQFPEKALLTILIVAPLSSLVLDFTILASGHSWDWEKIWELYKWRAAKGEMPEFIWGKWFEKMWEFAVTDFTLPVLIITIAYLTFGQLLVFKADTESKTPADVKRRFPQFWLFIMPALFQLFILKGALWKHQYWESPLVPFLAVATAQAIMLLSDLLAKISRLAANAAVVLLTGLIFIYCTMGTNYYYSIRWQSPAKIRMFEELNKKIPPNEDLLSFEDFIVNQHPAKGPHYRPEIAWYLDRRIVAATTMEQITKDAATGRYPYYLIPDVRQLMPLIRQLAQRYKYQHVSGSDGETTKDGQFLKAGMPPYFIFDLKSSAGGS
jgi:hypothetical protein